MKDIQKDLEELGVELSRQLTQLRMQIETITLDQQKRLVHTVSNLAQDIAWAHRRLNALESDTRALELRLDSIQNTQDAQTK